MATARSVDVLVIGGGPAGLAAALILSRTRRTVALFDSGIYRNASTLVMHNVPTYDGTDPARYRQAALDELKQRYSDTFQYIPRKALKLRKVEQPNGPRALFEVDDDQNETWIGRKVVLATGIQDRLPTIPGFEKVWGRSVVHCVYCHGTETKGQGLVILLDPANGPANGLTFGAFLQKFKNLDNKPITIIANGVFKEGEEPRPAPEYGIKPETLLLLKARGCKWELRAVESISADVPTDAKTHAPPATFNFADGTSLTTPFILCTPITVTPQSTIDLLSDPSVSVLKEGLAKPNAMTKLPMGEIPSSGFFPTSELPGVYVGGNSGLFMATAIMASNAGQCAGVGACNEIGMEDTEDEVKALKAA